MVRTTDREGGPVHVQRNDEDRTLCGIPYRVEWDFAIHDDASSVTCLRCRKMLSKATAGTERAVKAGAAMKLTKAQLRALQVLRDHGPLMPREFARQMWPESRSWTRASSRKRESGILRVAGALLHRLERRGWVIEWRSAPGRGYELTSTGRALLDQHAGPSAPSAGPAASAGHVIEGVEMAEIRPTDGAMRCTWAAAPDDPLQGTLWLTGPERPTGVQVGAWGRLVYQSTGTYGRYVFELSPNKEEQP